MKILFSLVIAILLSLNLSAQELPNIVPSPPDIIAFQKYGEIPVGYYTGVPNISIPLHKIVTKSGLEIPLTLSYHASGIKVDEKASRTGLGWSLNPGGAISKRIVGTPDTTEDFPDVLHFYPNNYFSNNDDYVYALGLTRDGRDYYQTDSGYDIYSYNFLNKSGKFFIDKNDMVNLIPYDNLKVTGHKPSEYFIIEDENGNKFYFQRPITSLMDTSCPPSGPSPSWIYSQMNTDILLSKIVTNLGEEIVFNYRYFNYSYVVSIDETDYSKSASFSNAGCSIITKKVCEKIMNHGEAALESITYNNETVKFIYSDDINYPILGDNERKDFPGNHALRKIVINYNLDSIKNFEFEYDYFKVVGGGNNPDSYRLKLTKLIENDIKKHQFFYNETVNLPKRFSYAQDYWGFYNGKLNNNTFLPEMYYGKEYFIGANREVSTTYTPANILTRMEYPTGGYSEFYYENNTYYDSNGKIYYTNEEIVFPNASVGITDYPFTITQTYNDLKLQIINECDNGNMDPNEPPGLPLEGENGLCFVKIINSNGQVIWENYITNTYDLNFLEPGDYTLRYFLTGNCLCNATILYKEKKVYPPGNFVVGGLRISKIKNFDNQNFQETLFEYNKKNSTESSGLIQGHPDFFTIFEKPYTEISAIKGCKYLVRNSSSIYPIATSGNSVGYSYVTEFKKDKNQYGKTEFEFTNFSSGFPPGFFSTLTPSAPNSPWKKGLLLNKTVYNSENDTLYSEHNEYAFDNIFASKSSDYYYDDKIAANLSMRMIKDHIVVGLIVYPAAFEWNYDFIESSWVKLIKTEKTSYFNTQPITTITNYFYDNPEHIQLTRTETKGSKEDELITKVYYPNDIKTASTLYDDSLINGGALGDLEFNAVNKLKTLHQIATPIQTETYKDLDGDGVAESDELLSLQRTNFKEPFIDIVLPESIEALKGVYNATTNKPETRIRYHSYYANGNVKEVSKEDGTHIVYIWGYNETQPIAKIENAAFAEVSSYIINLQTKSDLDINTTSEQVLRDALNNLRNPLFAPNLSKSQITTYTYDSLIGVTSITDPRGETIYYHYDNFNRLEFVKDAQGKILSKNEYHYKNQQ